MLKEKGHKSAGAIIRNKKGEILMLERIYEPFGWAGPAGHIDEGETPEQAMIREIKEEVNLEVKEYKLLAHEYIPWNCCYRGEGHDWFLFEVTLWEGKPKRAEEEASAMKWMSKEKLQKHTLEEIWKYWFEKLEII